LEAGSQVLASNRCKLLSSKAMGWHPRMPREELVDFINEFIEAAIEIKNTAANPPYAPASRCLPPQLSWYTKEELSGYARYRL
jgi:hypothetical protein